jgi:hypothetical protein
VTSTFALAWAERSVGQAQSHRRFLDYVIDGDSFYRRHGHDLVSVLGWFVPDEEHLAAQRLLGTSSPDVDGRTAISVCPEDGDLLCGALTARIINEGNEIHWIDLALSYPDHDNGTWQHDSLRLAGGPELRFDAEEYKSAIRQCLLAEREGKGHTSAQQRPQGASWWSRHRESRQRRRVPFYGVCPTCGHDWREHSGGFFEPKNNVCSECQYEVDHDQRETSAPPCRLLAPAPPQAQN